MNRSRLVNLFRSHGRWETLLQRVRELSMRQLNCNLHLIHDSTALHGWRMRCALLSGTVAGSVSRRTCLPLSCSGTLLIGLLLLPGGWPGVIWKRRR